MSYLVHVCRIYTDLWLTKSDGYVKPFGIVIIGLPLMWHTTMRKIYILIDFSNYSYRSENII